MSALWAAASVLQSSRGRSSFVYDLTTDHGHRHAYLAMPLDRHVAEILGQDNEVGRIADLEASLKPFFKGRNGAVNGVHADGRGQVHALAGSVLM